MRMIGCLTAFMVLAGCTLLPGIEAPSVRVIGLAPLESGALEQRFRVDLRVINPNGFDLDTNGVDFQLDINGARFARGVANIDTVIPARGDAVLPVTVSTSLFEIGRQVLAATRSESLTYEIRGKLSRRGAMVPSLPFSHSGSIDFDGR
jgi:LEA14-like dessication related protein